MFGQTLRVKVRQEGNVQVRYCEVLPGQPTNAELRMLHSRLLPCMVIGVLVMSALLGVKGWLTWGEDYVRSISFFGFGFLVLHSGNRVLKWLYGLRRQFKVREPKPQTQQQPQHNQQPKHQHQQNQNQQKQHQQGGGQHHQQQGQRHTQQQNQGQKTHQQHQEQRQQPKFMTVLANPVS